ncbi:MAG TPA: hypothetical protein VGD98_15865 [Ktedonobacteraceae bacterium]
MSWETLHEIFGLAATDDIFAQELLTNPVDAIEQRGYLLTLEEREAFRVNAARTLPLLCQHVLRQLAETYPDEERPE